jgi:hypothetical protein
MDMNPLGVVCVLLAIACTSTRPGTAEALRARGFAPPTRCVKDGRACFLAVRPVSADAFDLVIVEPGAPPRVRIEAWSRGPSDWALLGPVLRDTEAESREIEAALGPAHSSGPPG